MVQKRTAVDWADLPILLAVKRHGTLRAAAKALGLSHSTVLRRLRTVETSLGSRMLERLPSGRHELTPAGHEVFETAQHLEDLVMVMERHVQGRDLELAGPLRVTMPGTFMPLLARDLGAFCDRYPKIDLTIEAGLGFANLAHRESDVALRIAAAPSPELVGRRLVTVRVGVYGSETYLATKSRGTSIARHDFIGWDPSLAHVEFARWITKHYPHARIRCRITHDSQLRDAVDSGLGVTVVPCAFGDAQPGWRRLALISDLAAPLWVLSHRDLRDTARTRALRDLLVETVLANVDLIEGRRPQRAGRR